MRSREGAWEGEWRVPGAVEEGRWMVSGVWRRQERFWKEEMVAFSFHSDIAALHAYWTNDLTVVAMQSLHGHTP